MQERERERALQTEADERDDALQSTRATSDVERAAEEEKDGKDGGPEDEDQTQIGFWTVVMSTMSAALGVQSRANKERDFRSGRVAPFIVAGILFTVLFVLTIVGVVWLVIP